MSRRALITIAFILSSGCASAAEKVHVELILDASGSMWNKLTDGRFRIAAAKEALTDLISALPESADLDVGLRVYGSQVHYTDPSACDDTKLFVPIQGVKRDQLLSTVKGSKAIGATPIAKSLELAADDLPADGRKLVVVVTDGEESCGGDVAAAVERLRASGINAEVRFVGIGLAPAAVERFGKMAQIVNVNDAKGLVTALHAATKEAAPPVAAKPTGVSLLVIRLGKPVDGAKVEMVEAIAGGSHPASPTGTPGNYHVSLPSGGYTARVSAAGGDPAQQDFPGLAVTSIDENSFTLELQTHIDVRLKAEPASVEAGKEVTVHYEGAPSAENQWIGIGPAGADDVAVNWAEAPGASGSVKIRTQDQPGSTEARFYLSGVGSPSEPVARSQPFQVALPTASVKPPAEVPAGAPFQVEWTGPNNHSDFVAIVKAGAPEGSYGTYANTDQGSPASLVAPDLPGDYEVRYMTGQSSTTLARGTFRTTAVQASVKCPESVKACDEFEVTWTGPNNAGDYITIVPVGSEEGFYKDYRNTADAGSPCRLRAPFDAGAHEVRYVSGQSARTLARAPIRVDAIQGSVEAPASVKARDSFEVRWTGPNYPNDFITIVRQGAGEGEYGNYTYTTEGSPLHVAAPEEPGAYEIRYVLGPEAHTLASRPITVQ